MKSTVAQLDPLADPVIEVANLDFYYGSSQALFNLNMVFPRRQVTALIGPSGCGKSTFLRCINRMNDLVDGARMQGSIGIDSTEINSADLDVIELRRRVGMVFQQKITLPVVLVSGDSGKLSGLTSCSEK